MNLEVISELLRAIRIVSFDEAFCKFPFVPLRNVCAPMTAKIQPNMFGRSHSTGLEPIFPWSLHFHGSYEKPALVFLFIHVRVLLYDVIVIVGFVSLMAFGE